MLGKRLPLKNYLLKYHSQNICLLHLASKLDFKVEKVYYNVMINIYQFSLK